MKNIFFSKFQLLIKSYFFKRNFIGYFLMVAGITFLTFFVMFVFSVALYGVPDKPMYVQSVLLDFVCMVLAFWGSVDPYTCYRTDED